MNEYLWGKKEGKEGGERGSEREGETKEKENT